MTQELLSLAQQIQQIPAPTFQEQARAAFVLEKFRQLGLSNAESDANANVFARLPGGKAAPLIVSAHLDTVFPASTPLTIRHAPGRIYAPGLGDNSIGVAALLEIARLLQAEGASLPGDVWLAANSAEEGLGDLKGIKAVCARFGPAAQAYLVLEGMGLGHVYLRGIGVQRYRVQFTCAGGHSWADYGQPSAIHELTRWAAEISAWKLPSTPRSSLNIGRIGGGISINTLAAQAWLELDLRSEEEDTLQSIAQQVENSLSKAQRLPGVQVSAEIIGQRPAGGLAQAHRLARLAQSCLAEQGLEAKFIAGSTDANWPLSLGFPSLVLGITTGGGAHTTEEYIETAPAALGLAQVLQFVRRAWD